MLGAVSAHATAVALLFVTCQRPYEQVDALDYGLFVGNVLTEGGLMYADTFTDPATIP